MITIKGKSVFGGVSIGKIMFYKRNEKVQETSQEIWNTIQEVVESHIAKGNIIEK